ncbi:hypothetical protein [Psychroserpens mesophilus]|uniref:hypothetical protein n=1 Tax=Psychroserpens mesophilus TaxID=325473 RepID=UPI003D651C92
MKTICKLIFVLFVSIMYTSCEEDSVDNAVQPSNELVAIQETLNQASPINYTISNNLNTKIDYGSGNYQLQVFTDGKMTSIEFFNDGVASGNATYTYDTDDRLINSTRSFPALNQNSESQYEYTGNQILATNFSLDNIWCYNFRKLI